MLHAFRQLRARVRHIPFLGRHELGMVKGRTDAHTVQLLQPALAHAAEGAFRHALAYPGHQVFAGGAVGHGHKELE